MTPVKKSKKRKVYEKKLVRKPFAQRRFLIPRMQQEWKTIEREAKRERLVARAKDVGAMIGKVLLGAVVVGGVLTVAAIAPNLFGAIGKMQHQGIFFHKDAFLRSKNYLRRHGFVAVAKKGDHYVLHLTRKGIERALHQGFRDMKLRPTERWDGVWRMVMFDIPINLGWARDGFRRQLQSMGFYQLQESVFVTPHRCEDDVSFLVSVFSIERYVRFITTRDLSVDEDLLATFDLPRHFSADAG